jgi:hypothetical protein
MVIGEQHPCVVNDLCRRRIGRSARFGSTQKEDVPCVRGGIYNDEGMHWLGIVAPNHIGQVDPLSAKRIRHKPRQIVLP